jgi:phosphopantothenoylcysteine decarboxylase/phosphopantothenate--cysteine ligase
MFPTQKFKGKHILLAITGGIAAYKACELIRYLVTHGAEVRVMLTKSAEKFISRLTLETLSNNLVISEMFPRTTAGTHHINLADWAETAIVAPTTANVIGKLANGIADDFVTTTLMAVRCPIVVAPAMNSNMWNNPAVRKNIKSLVDYGILICPPEEGFLAEGYSGRGRLARLEYMVQYLYRAIHPNPDSLKGKKILITAGRTEEPIDPIRIYTNRSSGKMGYALSIECFARGADVTLVSGPSYFNSPCGIAYLKVNTAREMYLEVMTRIKSMDFFISAAAVSDFSPQEVSNQKIKKEAGELNISFKGNPDILFEVGKQKQNGQILIGFAVETENAEENASKKLKTKNLDMIVLNNPLEEGAGFGEDTNQVILISGKGEKLFLQKSFKLDISFEIIENFLNKGKAKTL